MEGLVGVVAAHSIYMHRRKKRVSGDVLLTREAGTGRKDRYKDKPYNHKY